MIDSDIERQVYSICKESQFALDSLLDKTGEAKKTKSSGISVPIKPIVPMLFSYLKRGDLIINIGGVDSAMVELTNLEFLIESIRVSFKAHILLNGQTFTKTITVPYVNSTLKSLFRGRTVTYGLLQVRFTKTPEFRASITSTGNVAKVSFGAGFLEIKVMPLHWVLILTSLLKITKVNVHSLILSEVTGSWVFSGLPGNFLPTLNWTNP